MNETQLIRRCQRGDRQAFEALIRQYYDYVSGFLLKATQDALLAQDLTQETFLKMIRSIETFDPGGMPALKATALPYGSSAAFPPASPDFCRVPLTSDHSL